MTPRGSIAGLILSAGASRRMGSPKALLDYQGETFLDRLIRLFGSVCDPVVVVLGHDAGVIRAGLRPHQGVLFTVNPDPERGMLSSLQCGLTMVPADAEAVMFTPVDHPNVTQSTLTALAQAYEAARAPVTIPVYQGHHGHPLCIAREVVDRLLALSVSAQAKDVIHEYYGAANWVEIADPGVVSDIDDPAAYRALINSEGALPKAVKV